MSSEKLAYDSTQGGQVTLPNHIQTYHYTAGRIAEIRQLLTCIEEPTSNKLVFQCLPKHMRRRAMSHHPKRLPRRYRAAHKAQMLKAGKPQQSKRPSRKFRRKPGNLLKEYTRRQRKHVWLETHIWHAKRFHMVERWGYKLALASCDKTYRACYRATAKHCLLQDISFFGCIEIKGDFEVLKEGFSRLTSTKCGLSMTAKGYTTGKREGSVHLFRANQFPKGALTKVTFFWKPPENLLEVIRTIWVFVHPLAYREVLNEFINVFQLVGTKNVKVPIDNESDLMDVEEGSSKTEKETKSELQLKFITKTFAYSRAPRYVNETTNVVLTELKDTMNRFRLTGPLSQAVLSQTLKVKPLRDKEPGNWFKEYFEDEKFKFNHTKQSHFWEKCQQLESLSQLAGGMILSLNVEDPRLNRPQKRSKAVAENYKNSFDRSILYDLPEELSQSPIWDFDRRNRLVEQMMSTQELCKMRNKHAVVPGERCLFENDLQPIPILLIQRPGSMDSCYTRLGYGCGWDIIVPSGYGMPFWSCFVMWGARPGGLRELKSVNRESGQDLYLPDTVSGKKEITEKYIELRNRYFRLPPNKRSNYKKLSISSPFKAPLGQLVKEWDNTDEFFVLREKGLLKTLQDAFQKNLKLPELPKGCLVPIYLKMVTRGNPGDCSLICLPKKEDLKRFLKRKKMFSHEPIYIEPLKEDDKEAERRNLRLCHKKLLKRLKNKRIREKRKLQETRDRKVKIRPAGTSSLVSEQFKKMCELWLPEKPSTVRRQGTRETFGYITQSDFSFTEATVTGIGYVTAKGLEELQKVCGKLNPMVLVRGTKSRHYCFASFKINLQV